MTAGVADCAHACDVTVAWFYGCGSTKWMKQSLKSLTYACYIVGNDYMINIRTEIFLLGHYLFTVSQARGLLNLTANMHR